MNTIHRTSLAIAATALGLFGSSEAFAQASWDLDACTSGTKAASGYLNCTGSGAGVNSTTVSVTAFSSSGGANYTSASINNGGSFIGVLSGTETSGTGSPHHAIDNVTSPGHGQELVMLTFSKAVNLGQIVAEWANDNTGGDADFRVWRWDYTQGTAPLASMSYSPSSMTGWSSVTATGVGTGSISGDFWNGKQCNVAGNSCTQSLSSGGFSSFWLISTVVGGSNDAFKLGTVSVTAGNICAGAAGTGGCLTTTTPLPEPATFGLAIFAGIAAVAMRRRRV